MLIAIAGATAGVPAFAGMETVVALRVGLVVISLAVGIAAMAAAASVMVSMGRMERWTILAHWYVIAGLGQLEAGRLIGWSIVGQSLAHGASVNEALLLGGVLGQALPWVVACGAVLHAVAPALWPQGQVASKEEEVRTRRRLARTTLLLAPALTAAFVAADVAPLLWEVRGETVRANGGPLGVWIASLPGSGADAGGSGGGRLAAAALDARLEAATWAAWTFAGLLGVAGLLLERRLRRAGIAARTKAESFATALSEASAPAPPPTAPPAPSAPALATQGAGSVVATTPPPPGARRGPLKAHGAGEFAFAFGFMNVCIAAGGAGIIYLFLRMFSAAFDIEGFDTLQSLKRAWETISGLRAQLPGIGAVAVASAAGILAGAATEGVCRGRRDLAAGLARWATLLVVLWPLGSLGRLGGADGHGLLVPVAGIAGAAVVAGGIAAGASAVARWSAAVAIAVGAPLFVQGGDWTRVVVPEIFFQHLLTTGAVAPSMVAAFPDYTGAVAGVMICLAWALACGGPAVVAIVLCVGAKPRAKSPPPVPGASTYASVPMPAQPMGHAQTRPPQRRW